MIGGLILFAVIVTITALSIRACLKMARDVDKKEKANDSLYERKLIEAGYYEEIYE